MRLRVLGSAAGGGLPQWNCACPNCRDTRAGAAGLRPRTQDSLAVSADGRAWFLCNASPDIRQQIESFAPLWPRGPRSTGLCGIVLSNGDLDHVLGLFSLREAQPLVVYATGATWRGLREPNALFRTLERTPDQMTWRPLLLGRAEPLLGPDGRPSGLEVLALPAAGKPPLHLAALTPPDPEDNVALVLCEPATGRRAVYAPGFASLDGLLPALAEADALLCDGTFFSADELVRLGLSTRRAADMAHLPIGGPEGSLARLRGLGRPTTRLFVHVNNTNPILRPGSDERRAVTAAGFEVAEDGLEIVL